MINMDVVELFLTKVTPFFDIYLPLQVCVKIPDDDFSIKNVQKQFSSFKDRVNVLKGYLKKWRNQLRNLDSEEPHKLEWHNSWTAGDQYVNSLMEIIHKVEAFDSEEMSAAEHMETCFDYSLSMYLVDLLYYDPGDTTLIIERFYNTYTHNEKPVESKVFPMTEVDDRESTTVVAEFRSIPAKKNAFSTEEYEQFARNFFELHN